MINAKLKHAIPMHLDYPIDENGELILQLTPKAGGSVQYHLFSHYAEPGALVKNILPLISVAQDGKLITFKINGQLFARFKRADSAIELLDSSRKLSVFETRVIGRSVQDQAPYPADFCHMLTPITDLHTHLSAQSSAEDLIRLGTAHGLLYPTIALEALDIDYPKEGLQQIPRRVFLPNAHLYLSHGGTEEAIPLSSLAKPALQTLQNALSLSPEGQSTFEDMERCYYLREPFTKDKRLLPDILKAIAAEYQSQDIRYAELSSNAVLEPEWLKIIHQTLPETEKHTGVALRFRAGIPRNLDKETLSARIGQYKRIAASPYIVGPDILGFEMNKTSHFEQLLDELLGWMDKNRPDASLQIHAGENAKNLQNVTDALQLADKHNIRIMVGHAIYGIHDHTMELAVKLAHADKLIIQFLADSNLAANNIDFPEDVPIASFLKAKVPSVLSSDGAPLYRTSPKQTAMAAVFCRVTAEGFKAIRATEETYMAEQKKIFDAKKAGFSEDQFFKSLEVPEAKRTISSRPVLPANTVAPELKHLLESGRRPIFFAGGGSNQPIGLGILLEKLDPEKFYLVKGRTKIPSINHELDEAIKSYNEKHTQKFHCITMLAESEHIAHDASPYFHTLKLSVPLLNLPGTVTDFLKNHNGFAFYIGGKIFTRNFILESHKEGIPFALLENIPGASAEKARIYRQNAFKGIEEGWKALQG